MSSRRDFLQLAAVGIAGVGLTGTGAEAVVPRYAVPPEPTPSLVPAGIGA